MARQGEGWRIIDLTVPDGAANVLTPRVQTNRLERIVLVSAPSGTGWVTSHIDAEFYDHLDQPQRIWSTNVSSAHFVVNLSAGQTQQVFSQTSHGPWRDFSLHIISQQPSQQLVQVMLIDEYLDFNFIMPEGELEQIIESLGQPIPDNLVGIQQDQY